MNTAAGWSSSVARWAHNPEVAGSNPAPATKIKGRFRTRDRSFSIRASDVKSYLSELVGRVHDHHERVSVTVHGRPSAVLVAPEDLERLEETLEILREPETMNRLASSDAELA